MKNGFLFLFIFAYTASVIQAQTMERNSLTFGAKVGVNYAKIYDSADKDFIADPKVGLAIGAFIAIPIGELFGIQPEALFSQRGFVSSGSILGNKYTFTRTTSNLDIPLLFAIKPIKFLTIVVGPQYSFLLRRKDVFASDFLNTEEQHKYENDNIRKNTLSLMGGLDLNFSKAVLGLRASYDMQYNKGDGTNLTPRYKNTWLQATIGFRI